MQSLTAIWAITFMIILPTIALADDTEAQYRMSRQCREDVKAYFEKEYGYEPTAKHTYDGVLLSHEYANHYSKSLNECYYLITSRGKRNGVPFLMEELFSYNEFKNIGIIVQMFNGNKPMTCQVAFKPCEGQASFNQALKIYMEN